MPSFNLEQNLDIYEDTNRYKKRYDIENLLKYCEKYNRKFSELNNVEIRWFTMED